MLLVAAGVIEGKIEDPSQFHEPCSASFASVGSRPASSAGFTTQGVAASITISRTFLRAIRSMADLALARRGPSLCVIIYPDLRIDACCCPRPARFARSAVGFDALPDAARARAARADGRGTGGRPSVAAVDGEPSFKGTRGYRLGRLASRRHEPLLFAR